jgi:hypothetical protein
MSTENSRLTPAASGPNEVYAVTDVTNETSRFEQINQASNTAAGQRTTKPRLPAVPTPNEEINKLATFPG